jgi:hypothetical protein
MDHERGLRVRARGGHQAAGDGVALRSAEHPYVITGFDAYGNRISEIIEVKPSAPCHPVRSFLMRHTPWWLWNAIWYRFGFTKMRMITRITTLNPDALVTEPLSLPSRDPESQGA